MKTRLLTPELTAKERDFIWDLLEKQLADPKHKAKYEIIVDDIKTKLDMMRCYVRS